MSLQTLPKTIWEQPKKALLPEPLDGGPQYRYAQLRFTIRIAQ
jgi:hypothetical protein